MGFLKQLANGLADYFKDDEPKLIDDEEWAAIQATEPSGEAENDPDLAEDSWSCPKCGTKNEPDSPFCKICGYYAAGEYNTLTEFCDSLIDLPTESIEIMLRGSRTYSSEEIAAMEQELQRRRATVQAKADDSAEVDEAEVGRLLDEYAELPPVQLYDITENEEYTPAARKAARTVLTRRGLSELRAENPELSAVVTGWSCVQCGTRNPDSEFFCSKCGEYRY